MNITGKFLSVITTVVLALLALITMTTGSLVAKSQDRQADSFVEALRSEQLSQEEQLYDGLELKGKMLAELAAGTAAGLIYNFDFETLKNIATQAAEDRDIAGLTFFDLDGDSIAGPPPNTEGEKGLIRKEIKLGGKAVGSLQVVLEFSHVEERLQQLATRIDQLASESEVTKTAEVEKIVSSSVWLAVIGLVALCLAIWLLFSKLIVRPLRQNMELAATIAQGNLSRRVETRSTDELGQLTKALNAMADGLQGKVGLARKIAEGDLSAEVQLSSAEDEFGRALRDMGASLGEMVGRVRGASEQIETGSAQVSDSSRSLSEGATVQAGSLEEITSSMAEMASQTRMSAENASQANNLADQAKGAAENGNAHMAEMIEAMGEINGASKEISKIIKTIDDIAFQTNLLALNAAVEAARAGMHGKGFAVVAEEVRNLASRCAEAAKETAELIEGSVLKVTKGGEIANMAGEALGEIVGTVTKVSDLVAEISAASNEQAQGISQVNLGLGQVDQVTRHNTAVAEQSAAASEELSSQAVQLRQMLERFKLKKDERASARAPAEVQAQAQEISWNFP